VAAVTAGLLHDAVEDNNDITIEKIQDQFGDEVALIVDGVTKIGQMEFTSHAERQAENMRKMILAMATDIRVILVKLADRLHNMRTLGYMPAQKQAKIAQETIDIYTPLAARLGIRKIQTELEDLCLFYLEPEIYQEIRAAVDARRGEREKYIREVRDLIADKMKEFNIPCRIEGRPKHIYSIYKKMMQQNLTINQVFDIIAFRIIVDSIKNCYSALGVIHSMFKPIPGRFKDYISLPKANGYQSLHSAVMGPKAHRMEVQIRTQEMHAYSENGIAAHWKYKEGDQLNEKENQRFVWLRSLMEWQRDLKDDPAEFMSNVRQGLLPEESYVYVFTPAGDVRELPRGATPVDFAYSIHTDVGHSCVGAKVNGSIASLKYQLQNGDTVEILTQKNSGPKKDWLGNVVTTKARHRIRQWFKAEERARSITLGRELLEKLFRKEEISFNQVQKEGDLDRVAREFSLKDHEELLASVGFGKISPRQVAGKLKPQPEGANLVERMVRRMRKQPREGIKVRGHDDILIRFPGCCNPLPGEDIVGYITQGRGVTVHSARCKTLAQADPQRRIDVEWEQNDGQTYPVRVEITGHERPGLLSELSGAMAESNANIIKANIEVTPENKAVMDFTIQVTGRSHLREVIQAAKKLRGVERVVRLQPKNN
jgi:GTP pyrophosphokinase